MSSINVNLTELNGIKRSLEKSQTRLSGAADGAASVRIDGAIAARRSIGSRISSANRSIQEIEHQVQLLITFLGDVALKYEHAEEVIDKLLSGVQDFREKRSAWDWLGDQVNYVDDKLKDAWKNIDEFVQDTLDLLQAYTSAMCELIDSMMEAINQRLDYYRDAAIANGANSIDQYFKTGVLKGLVDTIGGIMKMVIETPWLAANLIFTVVSYPMDLQMSDDPLEKLKGDIMSLPDKAIEMYSAIIQTLDDMKTDFMNADMNHKSEMIGFVTEKILEIFIPGGAAKNAGLGAKGLSAFARKGGELFTGLSDNLIAEAFRNAMEKVMNYEIRGIGDSLVPAGIGGAIPGGTTIREIFESMGLIRKSDTPEPGGKLPEGTGNSLKFRTGYDTHLVEVEDVVRKGNKGIVGGHNLDNFEKAFTDRGWSLQENIISKTPHPTINGVYEVKYQLPAVDTQGNIISGQYKNIPNPKTVYDPSVISNEQMLQWGQEAMANGTVNGRIITGTASNGLKFQGYIDNGEITNFFPTIK